ncbi:MAG TPA: serine/threonine-protein kinase [Kofleriaceae bacterium]|jgi:serine/threonine-protein kinase|nr:serine/threonine-protein kinase [Kofleriaceae bacterium]
MIATTLSTGDFLAPGTRLGKYELIQRLAVGGMAELYLARCTGIEGFEKLVAVKRILPQYAANEEFVQMFLDEARLAATLQHANIAHVYDIGQTEHGLFFTMEFVRGADARELLRSAVRSGEPIGLEHALTIVGGAAAGLHAAHEKCGVDGEPLGIVHRDVSPANILVSFDGCVKVIDFGVAKASRQHSQTRVGTLKGKISYMAPEQCQGEAVDRRCDVFALGIVLYELTCGRRLFEGDNEFAIMKKIITSDAPPPSSVKPGYPAELERIVLRALARDRELRYPTAQELQLELETFARGHGLVISSVRLGEWMRERFADKIAAWEQAYRRATRAAEELEIAVAAPPPPPLQIVDDLDDDEDLEVDMEILRVAEDSSTLAPAPAPAPARRRRGRLTTVACAAGAIVMLVVWLATRGTGAIDEPASPTSGVSRPVDATASVSWRPLAHPTTATPKAPAVRKAREAAPPPPRKARAAAPAPAPRKPKVAAPAWDPNSALPP